MPDYIDAIKAERDRGIRRVLSQDVHAAVNARYPGCTRERCCECDEETGRAGRGEDSIFIETDDGEIGPLCETCRGNYPCED